MKAVVVLRGGGGGVGGRGLRCRGCESDDLSGRDGEVRWSRRPGGGGGGGGGGGESRLFLRGRSGGVRSWSRGDGDGCVLTLLDVDSAKL